MNFTYVVILKDGEKKFEKVKNLSTFIPTVMVSGKGWIAIIGNFEEKDIKNYEYYPSSEDWQTMSGWMDLPL